MLERSTQSNTPQPPSRPHVKRPRRWLMGAGIGVSLFALLLGGTAFAASSEMTDALQQTFLEKLAGKLGITTDELNTAIQAAGNETVDDAVTNGDLTDEQAAALKERIAEGDSFFGFGHGFGRGHRFGGPGVSLDTVATTLSMTADELRTELEAGTALADIITAQGSTVDQVVSALVADAETRLAEKVAAGDITQAEADAMLAELPARMTEAIENGKLGPGHHHHGPGAPDDSSDSGDAEATRV